MSTVLVVQSDRDIQLDWEQQLRACGHEVLLADNSLDAIDRVAEGGIDVVVVDPTSARALSGLVESLDRLPDGPPFILVSSFPDAPHISAQLGAASFVPKPCTAEDIARVIQTVVPAVRAVRDDDPTLPRLFVRHQTG